MSAIPVFAVTLLLTAVYIAFLHRRYDRLIVSQHQTIHQLITLLGGVVDAEAKVAQALAAAGEKHR